MKKPKKKYLWIVFSCLIVAGLVAGYFLMKQNNKMPDTMPDDFAFSIKYGVESKNEINTFNGTVTKDLVMDGTKTVKFTFTKDEMQSIYAKMKEINIQEPKRTIPLFKQVQSTPSGMDVWKIRLNHRTMEFNYVDNFSDYGATKDKKELMQVRDFIINIMKNKEEYKKLPQAKGGYD